jgi:hypothetical protein
MISKDKSCAYFTVAQAAKLLGLYIREFVKLENGPPCYGHGEYITFRGPDLEEWTVKNVTAPAIWFDRFKNPDPRTADRCELLWVDDHYELSDYEEGRLLLKMVRKFDLTGATISHEDARALYNRC